ncbi:MAG: hypothetical protein LBR69_02990 [Endomicrobium sp.]|jgi:hypothetical protein|nr:hypothetical protein [Endomicrobium sp.]
MILKFWRKAKDIVKELKCISVEILSNNHGIAPVVLAAIISAAASVAGNAMSDTGPQTVSQESALSPEQQEIMKILSNYAKTGQLPGIDTAGMYDMSAAEQQGQNSLLSLISQNPELYDAAQNEYMGILGNKYDPYNPQGEYAAYKANIMKELSDSQDALNRNMGASGRFFSTSRNSALSDLYADMQRNLGTTMAGLYDKNADRKYSAAGALANLQGQKQGYDLNKITAANTYGGLSRNLNRQSFLDRLGAYSTVLNKNVDYYTPEVTSGEDNSTWNKLITGGLTNLKDLKF